MNQETLKAITAKIEKTIEQTRALKQAKATLEGVAEDLRGQLAAKDGEIAELQNSRESLLAEIRSLQAALNERDLKLQESEESLVNTIDTLSRELGLDVESSEQKEEERNLFQMNEAGD